MVSGQSPPSTGSQAGHTTGCTFDSSCNTSRAWEELILIHGPADTTHPITQPPHIFLRQLLAGHQVFNPSVQRGYSSGIGGRREVMRFGRARRVNLHAVVHWREQRERENWIRRRRDGTWQGWRGAVCYFGGVYWRARGMKRERTEATKRQKR